MAFRDRLISASSEAILEERIDLDRVSYAVARTQAWQVRV